MKKRIFLIVSSIVCSLLTLSLMIYAIVKAVPNNLGDGTGVDNPTQNTSKPGNEDDSAMHSIDVAYNMIVGDSITDEVLSDHADALPSSLSVIGDGVIEAVSAGNAKFSVTENGVVYNYSINVWSKGSGTKEDPFNIIRTEDLQDLLSENNKSSKYFVQQVDLDLAGTNWIPLGNGVTPFRANYDGNGHTIKNMSIEVTAKNAGKYISSYSNMNMMYLGFFGFVYGGYNGVTISNVSFENAIIDTSEFDSEANREDFDVQHMFVGTLAGYVYNATINGNNCNVTTTINSSAGYVSECVDGAVGGLVGYVDGESTINKYNVRSTIKATGVSYIGSISYGAYVGGAIGSINNSDVKNLTITSNITIGNYKDSRAAGVIAVATGESAIQNIKVNALTINVSKTTKNETSIRLSGAVDSMTINVGLTNVVVKNAKINGIGTGQVAGLVNVSAGKIKNCSVQGVLNGVYVAGLVDTNKGEILYTNEFEGKAVNVKINAQIWGAGVVTDNKGTITGAVNKTEVEAIICWYELNEDMLKKVTPMLAGIATYNSGKIKNLSVIAKLVDPMNAGGAIGWVNGENAILDTIDLYVAIKTIVQDTDSKLYQTYTVGGVACVIEEGKALSVYEMTSMVSVNHDAVEGNKYTLDMFGAIVGKMKGAVCTHLVEMQVKVFANDTLNKDGENSARIDRYAFLGKDCGEVIISSTSVSGNINVNGAIQSINKFGIKQEI